MVKSGYKNFDSLKDNYLKGLRANTDIFDLEFLKWAQDHPHIDPQVTMAIKLRITELEPTN